MTSSSFDARGSSDGTKQHHFQRNACMIPFRTKTPKHQLPSDDVTSQNETRTDAASDSHGSASFSSRNKNTDLLVVPATLAKEMPQIYKAPLFEMNLTFGMVTENDNQTNVYRAHKQAIRQTVVKGPKAKASICFVVKRPGCVLCFEQGHALSALISEFPDHQVAAWAVVKEIDTDNEGLLNLYQNYFRFPFFRDQKLSLYSALGDRRVGFIKNPFRIFQRYREIRKRLKAKHIKGNIIGKGEGMVLGGVIIFDQKGVIRYAHQESFSRELPVNEIRTALKQVVQG